MGIDIGTGGTRAILVDAQGKVVAAASSEHEAVAMPQPLWAEQHPQDWWRATQEAVRAALAEAGVDGSAVTAVGFSGQMHGVALLDKQGEVLTPALLWCDQRTAPQVEQIHQQVGREQVIAATANPMLTGFSAPKLVWLRQHRAELYARAAHFLLPKDYVRYRLTGELATDVSDASGTGLFDVAKRRWSEAMCKALEIPMAWLPRAGEGPEVVARVSAEGARATGLLQGTPVVAGGGDQAAGAVGNGIVRPGIASATVGTSGVVFAATGSPQADPQGRIHTFCHAVPGQWHMMGVTLAAGLSFRWVRDELGVAERMEEKSSGQDAYDLLTRLAAQAPAGSQGLIFLPYLMGERTPHLDAQARGGWIGLTASHKRAHLVRSVLEGVAYSLRDSLTIFRDLGITPTEIRLSGGGAKGEVWPRIQASIYQAPCVRVANVEGAAYGAALLAQVGSGLFPSVEEACAACVQVQDRVPAETGTAELYNQGYAVYRELYPALRRIYPQLS